MKDFEVIGVLSGETHLSFSPVSTAISHANIGKLRMLRVSSTKRLVPLPDMPTVAEAGVPGYEFSGWQGVLVPAGTPQEIIARLHAAILKAIHTQEFKDYLSREGSELVGSTPAEFATFIRGEVAKNAERVRSAGIRAE